MVPLVVTLTLVKLAAVVPTPTPVPGGSGASGLPGGLPWWAYLLGLLITGVLAPLAVGYMGHRLREGQKETKAAVQEVATLAADTSKRVRETERKVTSNRDGRDTIEDKVDQLKNDMGRVVPLLQRLVDTSTGLSQRMDDLEELTKATVGAVGDSTVTSVVSFEELHHTLDGIAPPMAEDGVRYCRRRNCRGEADGCTWPHRPEA